MRLRIERATGTEFGFTRVVDAETGAVLDGVARIDVRFSHDTDYRPVVTMQFTPGGLEGAPECDGWHADGEDGPG